MCTFGMLLTTAGCEGRQAEETNRDSVMEVHFIDVGQGDATLVKCGSEALLIDAGDDTKGTLVQNYLRKQGVEKLDYLILTHPDSDHIGGAPVIVTKFDIEQVLVSNYEKDNSTYRKLMQALDDKGLTAQTPEAGNTYELGGAMFTILGPVREYDNPNDASVALLLRNGKNRFLFTGDAEEAAECDMLDNGIPVRADVYQAGHHGSRTSSSEAFLDAATPSYAVISCAEGNSYGHPHAQTMNALRSRGIQVFRTDEQGTIIAEADGERITWNCAPSDTWQAGEPTGSAKAETEAVQRQNEPSYVLNVKTKKFHRPDCSDLPTANRQDTTAFREEVIAQGYEPCKRCEP
ncbi:MAG: MBL fold metallo-hydrolase [Lachnospiraceae bacterium]|nr:MBL fold metallo-hydrolase [Lachnospiraceae bacterium]